jgi:hypothetical protein
MGLQLHGWVELQNLFYGSQWEGAIKVDSLSIGRINELFIHVFGIRPSGARVENELGPLAAARGIPSDASPEVRECYPDDCFVGYPWIGQTWVLWSELEQTPWGQGTYPSGESLPTNWRTLFDLMALLAKEFGANHVRLVAWFV